MSKKLTNVKILSRDTIELREEGKPGDIIVLSELNVDSIDTNILGDLITQGRDMEYNRRLEEARKTITQQLRADHLESINPLNQQITSLTEQLKSLESQVTSKLKDEYHEKITDLEKQLITLRATLESQASKDIKKKDDEIIQLRADLEALKKGQQTNIDLAVQKSINEANENLQKKDEQINNLTLEVAHLTSSKSSKNTKRMGEDLEKWCSDEYASYAMAFGNCVWTKDNDAVLGDDVRRTKADFIFKIYSDDSHEDESLLTTVVLEMKTEDPTGKTPLKNSDHIAKLVKDKQKKRGDYAILVSELEWNTDNDPLIRKVEGEENVYIVRPPYLVTFLSILNALSLKYKHVKEEITRHQIEFKKAYEILEEFKAFKDNILNNSFRHLESGIEAISKNNAKMRTIIDDNDNTIRTLLNTHINTIKNKINGFNIDKLAKRIDDLD